MVLYLVRKEARRIFETLKVVLERKGNVVIIGSVWIEMNW